MSSTPMTLWRVLACACGERKSLNIRKTLWSWCTAKSEDRKTDESGYKELSLSGLLGAFIFERRNVFFYKMFFFFKTQLLAACMAMRYCIFLWPLKINNCNMMRVKRSKLCFSAASFLRGWVEIPPSKSTFKFNLTRWQAIKETI